ncbi:MAG: hypothetical protein ACRCTS_03675 [Fusobacteriaceae bacterium]
MNNFFNDGKIKLYQKDNRGQFQISERNNDLMHISNLREMKEYGNLENYCTKINDWYMPVNVLAHITKHFPGDSNPKKLALIEDILNFRKKDYSYVIYTTADERYRMLKAKVKLNLYFIQVMRENELFEICITDSVKIGKKEPLNINQINSYYKVDAFHEERLEKLQYSNIKEASFRNESEKYHIFQLTQDSRLRTEKPLEVFEKEDNRLAIELLKATGKNSIDLNLKIELKDPVENPSPTRPVSETISPLKLTSEEIRDFFREKDGQITVEEVLNIYFKDTLPLNSNRSYTLNKILKSSAVKRFSPLYFTLNVLFNSGSDSFDCRSLVSGEEESGLLLNEIIPGLNAINSEFKQELFSSEGSHIVFNIKF